MNAAVHVLGKLLLTSRPVEQHDPDRHGTLKGQKYLQRRRRAASRVHGANGGCLPAGCSLPVWSRPGWLGPAPQHCAVQHRGCNAGPLAPQGLGSGSCPHHFRRRGPARCRAAAGRQRVGNEGRGAASLKAGLRRSGHPIAHAPTQQLPAPAHLA